MKNRLRVLRAERDWSQAELAGRLGGIAANDQRPGGREVRSRVSSAGLQDRPGCSAGPWRRSSAATPISVKSSPGFRKPA